MIPGELRIKFLPMSCIPNLFWFFVCNLTNSLVPIFVSQYWISLHLILQLRGHIRGNQMPWKDPWGVLQIFFDYQLSRHCWTLKPFPKPDWNFEKNGLKYLNICLNINLSYIFQIFWPIIIFWCFRVFLCTEVIFASFSEDENVDCAMESFRLVKIKSTNKYELF